MSGCSNRSERSDFPILKLLNSHVWEQEKMEMLQLRHSPVSPLVKDHDDRVHTMIGFTSLYSKTSEETKYLFRMFCFPDEC